jgi:L-rhamnose mutarotase
VPESSRSKLDISSEVQDISETCKKICQQQMYQSWWALGESLEKDLEPKLDKLEDTCRKVAREVQVTAAP